MGDGGWSCQGMPELFRFLDGVLELSEAAEDRWREAPPERLGTWGKRLLEASRLKEIFGTENEY